MISHRAVFCLALAQLIAWGTTYYLIGVFGAEIGAEFGWSRDVVYGGFAAALAVMGLTSTPIGRLIDRHGGHRIMVAGAFVTALGCVLLAACWNLASYYTAWLALGLAMRLTLYDAAFAALARIAGTKAARPISQITLLGGLASTVFWPVGHELAQAFGWRGAVLCYAGFALLTVPLYLALPTARSPASPTPAGSLDTAAPAVDPRRLALLGGLYALIVAVANFLNAGLSSHLIGMLGGLGVAAATAVWISTLRGIGQSLARLAEVLSGGRISPLMLNLIATATLPLAFAAGLASGVSLAAAAAFAFLYGAGNGVLTITRGTLPLVLFDPRSYGVVVGRLIAPSFLVSAAAPVVFALVGERSGAAGELALCLGLAALAFAAALALRALARRPG
ncbi:MFS transporter [Starkeya koreensis]|uniref:MFS transporter n=1 Tax=Ancylobacter koreensis TaxID=266121 RepID=A0ABT0DH60_9HYPH|nr:MFS transporter [Ancylobacter koreensis]